MLKKLFRFVYKNDLVLHILDEIQQCIAQEYLDKYIEQITYIDKFSWVLNKEVNLYFSQTMPDSLNIKLYQERRIANLIMTDIFDKTYKMKIYFVHGHIFSLESNLPFKGLLIEEIKDISIICSKDVSI